MKTTRRQFLGRTAQGAAMVAAGQFLPLTRLRAQSARPGSPPRLPLDWSGGSLTVASANLHISPGYFTAVSAINGSVPGPTIRVRRGEEFAARVQNSLRKPLVLHWHGVLAPKRLDGHPRDQIAAGQITKYASPSASVPALAGITRTRTN